MKNSIKRQMMKVFLGLVVMIITLTFIINTSYLERFYVENKQRDMTEVYRMLGSAVKSGAIDSDRMQSELLHYCEWKNLLVTAVGKNDGVIFCTEKEERGSLFSQLFGYRIGMNDGEILKTTEKYTIYKTKDPNGDSEYIEMYGLLGDDAVFIMQSPLESIRESVMLTNQFLIYIGGIVLGFGLIFIWFFSKRLTKPIMELAELSEKMAHLDFDAKYTSGGEAEIGILGKNFNLMSEKLEETISELKRANNQLQKDIEQKQKMEDMRSEFLGNVSHELKTPIALIQGYAEGLKEGISDDPESREFYCDVIMDEASKMNQMVKNLLVLNQLEFGDEELEFERFDIVGMIRGVITSCEILIQQAEAEVDFIADEEAFVWADEFKTEQVLRNYLTNAIHHVDNEKRIEIRVTSEDDTVRVTVFNSGKPIPEEDIGKLWDKFYKVDKAHTREYGGNGIGLSIVKAIMESFHQKYGVKNYDNGVEFWFELDGKAVHTIE